MNTTTAAQGQVKWTVVGYSVAEPYQACPGAPVQHATASCEKCGQGIKYIVRLKSSNGDFMQVGQDCAVTMEGGVELRAIRNAQRAYEHAQYLASDAYKKQRAAELSRKERQALCAETNKTECFFVMEALRIVKFATKSSEYDRDRANAVLASYESGAMTGDLFEKDARWIVPALQTAMTAESTFYSAPKAKFGPVECLFTRLVSFEGMYGLTTMWFFTLDTGEVLVWKGTGGDLNKDHEGQRVVLSGTVKGHNDYKGVKQTAVTRCKVARVSMTAR